MINARERPRRMIQLRDLLRVLPGGKDVVVRPAKIAEFCDAEAAGFSDGPAAP